MVDLDTIRLDPEDPVTKEIMRHQPPVEEVEAEEREVILLSEELHG